MSTPMSTSMSVDMSTQMPCLFLFYFFYSSLTLMRHRPLTCTHLSITYFDKERCLHACLQTCLQHAHMHAYTHAGWLHTDTPERLCSYGLCSYGLCSYGLQTCPHPRLHACLRAYLHKRPCARLHTCLHPMFTHMRTHVYTHVHTSTKIEPTRLSM